MIIGLTGKNGAGKTEICKYLKSKGFNFYSLSDILRDELKKRGEEVTRENLISIGNELRKIYGASVLANKLLEKVDEEVFVVDSIRNPEEVKEFRKRKKFFLIGVEAPIELRYKRIQERKRAEDKLSFEEFKKYEEIENTNSPSSQQLDNCIKLADKVIENGSTLEELHKKVDDALKEIINSTNL